MSESTKKDQDSDKSSVDEIITDIKYVTSGVECPAIAGQEEVGVPQAQSEVEIVKDVENDADTYKCGTCGEYFESIEEANTHMLSHGTLSVSDEENSDALTQLEKSLIHITGSPQSDDEASMVVERPDIKRARARINSKEIPKKRYALKTLVDEEADKKVFICTECSASYGTQAGLKYHVLHKHSLEMPFTCPKCDYKCKTKGKLKTHMLSHTGEKPFQCTLCDSKYTTAAGLRYHMKAHSGADQIKAMEDATNAAKTLIDIAISQIESKIVHDTEQPQVDAKEIFEGDHVIAEDKQNGMEQSKDIEPAERTENETDIIDSSDEEKKCGVCRKSFKTEKGFFNHQCKIRVQYQSPKKEVKKLECPLCSATFTSKSGLNYHKKAHAGVRPFECVVCNAKFARKNVLRVHTRLHTGDKPFKCEMCDAKYCTNDGLKFHMYKHTGERPFACGYCSSKFIRKDMLRNHERTHTGDVLECTVCNSHFTSKSVLKRHLKVHERPVSKASKTRIEQVSDELVSV